VLPLSRRATEVGDPLVANVVALGALVALRDVVSRDALRRAVRERVRPQFQELNLSALDVGFRLGAEASRPALA
jgi:2-oxoglutarate ferredoxin oxidoreductase subunit gamma